MDKVTTLDILRHGKPEGGEIFRGHVDVEISELGYQQMTDAVSKLSGWDRIVSSPMRRCRVFAEDLAKNRALDFAVIDGFREISFGDWDGQLIEDVRRNDAEGLRRFWNDPLGFTPPNGEPMDLFYQRVQDAMEALVASHEGEHMLISTHGGVIRALINAALGGNSKAMTRYEVPYACVTRFKFYHSEGSYWPQLIFHNLNCPT